MIFVYNADSGFGNAVKDYFKKAFKPSTYECRLCGLTYGALGVKRDWKKNLKSIDFETEFLHKDEFNEKFDIKGAKFPSAYILNSNSLTLLISQEEMNNLKDLDELINFVDKKLAETV